MAKACQEVVLDKAITQLRALVAEFPESLNPRIELAKRLAQTGELKSGIDLLTETLPDSESSSVWQVTLGTLYLEDGNTAQALELLAQACRLAPNSAKCHLWHAKV